MRDAFKFVIGFPVNDDPYFTVPSVSSDYRQLLSLIEIRNFLWIHIFNLHTSELDFKIGQNRITDFIKESSYPFFNILLRLDIIRDSLAGSCDLIQQERVNIIAYSKSEYFSITIVV